MKILVSACLMGERCRYDGKSKPNDAVKLLEEHFELIPVCPETLGGLSIPRTPSEIVGERVLTEDGEDRTEQFLSGAQKALQIAKENGCKFAVMKEKSPSCGSGLIHDGNFSGQLIKGWGVAAKLLKDNGIRVIGENQIDELLKQKAQHIKSQS